MTRIASLVPSITELLIALGLREYMVARTGFCIHPADDVRDIPKVGGTKDVNLDKLRSLRPTHVIVNVDETRLDTVDAIRAWPEAERPEVIVTHPNSPDDNLALVDQLVQAFNHIEGVVPRANACRSELMDELIRTRPDAHAPQNVLYLIWRGPWMTVARDTYISRMLARVNWRTLPEVNGGEHGALRYPVFRGDELWLADVDRVLLSSEPYAFGPQHIGEALSLCPNADASNVDGELISWYGPRAAAGLRYLRGLAA